MKAKVCQLHAKRDLRIEEFQLPPIGPSDVLIAVGRGGICGSDLHYFFDGGFGPIQIQHPIILGHEVSGTIIEVGSAVKHLNAEEKIAINPSQPCGSCDFCDEANFQHCVNMRFLGSARTVPHVQGGFRELIVINQKQCHKIKPEVSLAEAACAEPLAVCLHAANQAGDLADKRVMVTGAGPIGSLCVAVAALRGASEIIVTDLQDFTLSVAQRMGATKTFNVSKSKSTTFVECDDSNNFDVIFECSAAEPAIHTAIQAVRPRGTIIQVGVTGSISLPLNALVGKEIVLKGTHRFHQEFQDAVDLINRKAIDVTPIITQIFTIDEAEQAFSVANNRKKAVKVQIDFQPSSAI